MKDILFVILFIVGLFYLIRYQLKLKKAVDLYKNVVFPINSKDFRTIIIPNYWHELQPLRKDTKPYNLVKWGTIFAVVVLLGLLWLVLSTNLFQSTYLTVIYLILLIMTSIRHPGNLFILTDGIILDSKYYDFNQIKTVEIEEIIKWHSLYGLDAKINNGYKFSVKVKNKFPNVSYVVIREYATLQIVKDLLDEKGVPIHQHANPIPHSGHN